MRYFNTFLGAIAKVNARLARYRINMIPLNGAAMLGLAAWAYGLGKRARDTPSNSQTLSAMAAAVLVCLLFVCFCIVSFRRNTVFEGGGTFAKPLASVPTQPVPVRVTGRLETSATLPKETALARLLFQDARPWRRFVDVPTILAVERGTPVLASRIDTSQRYIGPYRLGKDRREGIWRMSIKPGTVQDGRFGFQYFGFSRRPAFRFGYVNAGNGKAYKGVIAADEPEHVLMAAATLTAAAQRSSATHAV